MLLFISTLARISPIFCKCIILSEIIAYSAGWYCDMIDTGAASTDEKAYESISRNN